MDHAYIDAFAAHSLPANATKYHSIFYTEPKLIAQYRASFILAVLLARMTLRSSSDLIAATLLALDLSTQRTGSSSSSTATRSRLPSFRGSSRTSPGVSVCSISTCCALERRQC